MISEYSIFFRCVKDPHHCPGCFVIDQIPIFYFPDNLWLMLYHSILGNIWEGFLMNRFFGIASEVSWVICRNLYLMLRSRIVLKCQTEFSLNCFRIIIDPIISLLNPPPSFELGWKQAEMIHCLKYDVFKSLNYRFNCWQQRNQMQFLISLLDQW